VQFRAETVVLQPITETLQFRQLKVRRRESDRWIHFN
jgi:hypothetical protein